MVNVGSSQAISGALSGTSSLFVLAALASFSITTTLYLFAIMIMDFGCGVVILARRNVVAE